MPTSEISLDAVPLNQPIRVEGEDMGIVLIRTSTGVTAYEDVCPHAQWRLSEGEIVNGRLECPGHGWEFDVSTGQCATVPLYCLRAIRVEVLPNDVIRLHWETRSVRQETSHAATNR